MEKYFVLLLCAGISCGSVINLNCMTKSGLDGTCKPLLECDILTEKVNSGDLSDLSPCDFDGSIGVFCCPNSVHPMHSLLTKSCQRTVRMQEQLSPATANYNEHSAISSINELPFMAQVIFLEKGFVGSGALISETFVLTSAHAVYVRRSMPLVRLGKTTRNDLDRLIPIDINVKQVIPHELFIPRELYYDIALLLLERPAKLLDRIFPACLHNREIILDTNQTLMLAGWKGNNGRKINELMKGKVKRVSQSKCQEFYNGDNFDVLLPNKITANLFCGKFSSCTQTTDSDGPVFVSINGTFFIYGFASTTNTNCNSQSPGIYTRISDVVDWIENIIDS